MKRREFIGLLAGTTAGWPLVGRAQQAIKQIIGFLAAGSAVPTAPFIIAFRQGLSQLGCVDGDNVVIEQRWADGRYDRLATLADELIKLKPAVIVAGTTAVTLAVKKSTEAIPIVCVDCTDPVGVGLVKSEARPGTNVTGFMTRVEGMTEKQLGLALEAFPGLSKIGLLTNPSNPSNPVQQREAEPAAEKLGLSLATAEARTPSEIYPALQRLALSGAGMVLVLQDSMFLSERKRIALLAAAARLPTMSSFREMVQDGGLISYGIDPLENYRTAASYVARILKGEKPNELPMQFPTRLVLTINLIVAKALGLTISPDLISTADEVIE